MTKDPFHFYRALEGSLKAQTVRFFRRFHYTQKQVIDCLDSQAGVGFGQPTF